MTRAAVHAIVRHAIAITGIRDLTKHTVTLRDEQLDQAVDRIIDDLAGLVLEQKAKRDEVHPGPACGCDECMRMRAAQQLRNIVGESNVER